jgi:predicted Zn-ribbon and HTH transcriptional regulator
VKKETPLERYWRRRKNELDPLIKAMRTAVEAKEKELNTELEQAQKQCAPHIDNGAMFYGACKKCGFDLG